MSEGGPSESGKGRGLTRARTIGLAVGAAAALAILYIMATLLFKPQAVHSHGPAGEAVVAGAGKLADAPPGAFHVISLTGAKGQGAGVPDAKFVDGSGKSVTLSDFKGKVVLLNLWATWCAPCRKEMPQMAALQKAYQGKDVVVLALSQDNAKATDKAKAFIAENAPLAFYQDADFAVPPVMTPVAGGFPTSYFIDRTGHIRGVVNGDADWTGPKARAALDQLLSE